MIPTKEINDDQLVLHYAMEGFVSKLNEVNIQFSDQFYLIDELVATEGAVGVSHTDNFYTGFKQEDQYTIPHQYEE